MSFLTCLWLLPQKLQSSCSLASDARAIVSFYLDSVSSARPGALAVLDDAVDDPVFLRFLRCHEVIPLHVLGDFLELLPCVLADDLLEPSLERDRLAGCDLDVGRLTLEAARHLVDQDLGVRQRHPLPCRATREDNRAHAHRDADADRLDVGLDELHRVVDGEARVDLAARRVDVDRDVLVRVLRLEMQELGDDEVRDLVVDRRAEEDDPLVQQAGVDVERALAARRLLDHHRDKRAHAGSLGPEEWLPGGHSFVSCSGFSLSGVHIASRAAATSTGIGFTSATTRSSAARRRRSWRRSSWRPECQSSSITASGSSSAPSACSRTRAFTSSSDTSIPAFSATASSASSRATESDASCRIDSV